MSKPAWYSPVASVAGVVAETRAVFNTGALSPLAARKAALQALLDLVKENDAALKEAYAQRGVSRSLENPRSYTCLCIPLFLITRVSPERGVSLTSVTTLVLTRVFVFLCSFATRASPAPPPLLAQGVQRPAQKPARD
jgi:hypothetical protein